MVIFGEKTEHIIQANSQQAIKETNARSLFRIISENENISRTSLVKASGLSPATVSVIINEMIRNGFIRQTGEEKSATAGRRPIKLDIDPDAMQFPAFSFRANGLLCVIYDFKLHRMEELYQPYSREFPEGRGPVRLRKAVSAESVYALFRSILDRSVVFDPERTEAFIISYPGNYLEDRKQFRSSLFGWIAPDGFIRKLRKDHPGIPVLAGDETLFMASCGRAHTRNAEGNALYIFTGNGVGSAIVVDNKFYRGLMTEAGEIGHVSVDLNGVQCACGNKGCLECYMRTDAVISAVLDKIHAGRDSLVLRQADYNERSVDLAMIGESYAAGDTVVSEVMLELADKLIVAIANLFCGIGAMDVYIGGDIRQLGDPFLDLIRQRSKEIGYRHVLDATSFQWVDIPAYAECEGGVIEYIYEYLRLTGRQDA